MELPQDDIFQRPKNVVRGRPQGVGRRRPLALRRGPYGDLHRTSFGDVCRTFLGPNIAEWKVTLNFLLDMNFHAVDHLLNNCKIMDFI